MQLSDVRLDRFGSLNNTATENLSRQITVFFGPAGSGKTTVVRFVRDLLFGYRRNPDYLNSEAQTEVGSARVMTTNGPRTLRRSWAIDGAETFSVTDEQGRLVGIRQDNQLPAWVTDDVFREIFSVGQEEAERFDLLTRLCIESGTVAGVADAELRQAEAALAQTVRDRDGNGIQGGVVHHISELRRRQGELQGEISLLRKPAPDLPTRIEQLMREIEAASVTIDQINGPIRDIDSQIARLEQLLIPMRQRNVLPLNRVRLDEEIRAVSARLDKWREIRTMIHRETEPRLIAVDKTLRADDSVRSIRSIITRLEERSQTLTDRLRSTSLTDIEASRYAELVRQLRGEIAVLCQYFGQHERFSANQTSTMQTLLAERSLADAEQMERLLEEQLASLRTELSRAENILSESAVPGSASGCQFTGHRESIAKDALHGALLSESEYRSGAEVEAQLLSLRAERNRLLNERTVCEEERSTKRILLDRLRLELAACSSLEQLDVLRAQIAELDAEISLLEDQRRQLDRTEISLREVIVRLKGRSHSQVLELASQYVRRLTEGECQQISTTLPDRLLIQTNRHPGPLTPAQLTRGTRDMIALALRLALIQTRARTHGHVPLILDEVFVPTDSSGGQAAAQLLTEIAQQGQQILFFTGQKEVRDLFARCHSDIRSFAARVELPAPPAPVALHAYVEPRVEVKPPVIEPVVYLQPAAPPQPVVAEHDTTTPANWLFYLEVDHGVEDLAGITLGELEALRSAGILTIDDLLNRTVPQMEEAARQKGFILPVDRIQALRGQAELTTRVPMLRRSDAALLFASGIRSVEELGKLRPETVYDRVSEFQRSEAGSRFRRGGRLIDRQQAINWARFGQFTRSLDEARHNRSRFAVRSPVRSLAPMTHGTTATSGSTSSVKVAADPAKSRRRRRVVEDLSTEERRARRQVRRQRQASRLRTEVVEPSDDESRPVERVGGMRFFLSRTSEIEKAPSIGPRTAEMMEVIGVRTVEDLLSMTPDRLAEKLNHKRITPSIIQQWQAQSRLMCQIPELRGHDAQILVACHITSPENLAARKPAELFAIVEPFSRTKEGERIIRTGRKPDVAEVTEWIQWAANARSMRAA